MGTVHHDAMIVTSWNASLIGRAHDKAIEIFGPKIVTPLGLSVMNRYSSFLIQGCGSKQGWGEEERHTEHLRQMAQWLKSEAYEDGSNSLEWVAVRYGNDLDEVAPHVLELGPPINAERAQ